jgi:hypothetical protein
MWLFLLVMAVTVAAHDTEMACPGLETMVLTPQCINDRDTCPQNSTLEPKSKVCGMCDGCTAYLREYETMLFNIRIQFIANHSACGINTHGSNSALLLFLLLPLLLVTTCSTHERDEKWIEHFSYQTRMEQTIWKIKFILDDNIKVNFQQMECESVD